MGGRNVPNNRRHLAILTWLLASIALRAYASDGWSALNGNALYYEVPIDKRGNHWLDILPSQGLVLEDVVQVAPSKHCALARCTCPQVPGPDAPPCCREPSHSRRLKPQRRLNPQRWLNTGAQGACTDSSDESVSTTSGGQFSSCSAVHGAGMCSQEQAAAICPVSCGICQQGGSQQNEQGAPSGSTCQSSTDCATNLFCAVECFDGTGCTQGQLGRFCQHCSECTSGDDAVDGNCGKCEAAGSTSESGNGASDGSDGGHHAGPTYTGNDQAFECERNQMTLAQCAIAGCCLWEDGNCWAESHGSERCMSKPPSGDDCNADLTTLSLADLVTCVCMGTLYTEADFAALRITLEEIIVVCEQANLGGSGGSLYYPDTMAKYMLLCTDDFRKGTYSQQEALPMGTGKDGVAQFSVNKPKLTRLNDAVIMFSYQIANGWHSPNRRFNFGEVVEVYIARNRLAVPEWVRATVVNENDNGEYTVMFRETYEGTHTEATMTAVNMRRVSTTWSMHVLTIDVTSAGNEKILARKTVSNVNKALSLEVVPALSPVMQRHSSHETGGHDLTKGGSPYVTYKILVVSRYSDTGGTILTESLEFDITPLNFTLMRRESSCRDPSAEQLNPQVVYTIDLSSSPTLEVCAFKAAEDPKCGIGFAYRVQDGTCECGHKGTSNEKCWDDSQPIIRTGTSTIYHFQYAASDAVDASALLDTHQRHDLAVWERISPDASDGISTPCEPGAAHNGDRCSDFVLEPTISCDSEIEVREDVCESLKAIHMGTQSSLTLGGCMYTNLATYACAIKLYRVTLKQTATTQPGNHSMLTRETKTVCVSGGPQSFQIRDENGQVPTVEQGAPSGSTCQSSTDCATDLFCAVECFDGIGCTQDELGRFCQQCSDCTSGDDAVDGNCAKCEAAPTPASTPASTPAPAASATRSPIFIQLRVVEEEEGNRETHQLLAVWTKISPDGIQEWGTITQWTPAIYSDEAISITHVKAVAMGEYHVMVVCEVFRHAIVPSSQTVVFAAKYNGSNIIDFGEPLVLRTHERSYAEAWLTCGGHDIQAFSSEDALVLLKSTSSCETFSQGFHAVQFNPTTMAVTSNPVQPTTAKWFEVTSLTEPMLYFDMMGIAPNPQTTTPCEADDPDGRQQYFVTNNYPPKASYVVIQQVNRNVVSRNIFYASKLSLAICDADQYVGIGDHQSNPFSVCTRTTKRLYGGQVEAIDGQCEAQNDKYFGVWTVRCRGLNEMVETSDPEVNDFGQMQFVHNSEGDCRLKRCYLRGDFNGYIPSNTHTSNCLSIRSSSSSSVTEDSCPVTCMNGWSSDKAELPEWGTFASARDNGLVNARCEQNGLNFKFTGCVPVAPMRMDRTSLDPISAILSDQRGFRKETARAAPTAVSVAVVGDLGVASMSFRRVVDGAEVVAPVHIQAFSLPQPPGQISISEVVRSRCAAVFRDGARGGNSTPPKVFPLGNGLVVHICKYMSCYDDYTDTQVQPTTTTTTTTVRIRGVVSAQTDENNTATDTNGNRRLSGNEQAATGDAQNTTAQNTTTTTTTSQPLECNAHLMAEVFTATETGLGQPPTTFYVNHHIIDGTFEYAGDLNPIPTRFDATALSSDDGSQRVVLLFTKSIMSKTTCTSPHDAPTPAPPPAPPPAPNGEEACENMGYDEPTCNSIGCCDYNGGQCWSSIGAEPCPQAGGSDGDGGDGDGDGYGDGDGGEGDDGPSGGLCAQFSSQLPPMPEPSRVPECEMLEFALYSTIVTVDVNGTEMNSTEPLLLDIFPTAPFISAATMGNDTVMIACTGDHNATHANGNIDSRPYAKVIGLDTVNDRVQKLGYGEQPVFSIPSKLEQPSTCQGGGTATISPRNDFTLEANITLDSSLRSTTDEKLFSILTWGNMDVDGGGFSVHIVLSATNNTGYTSILDPGTGRDGLCYDPESHRHLISHHPNTEPAGCQALCTATPQCTAVAAVCDDTDPCCCWLLNATPTSAYTPIDTPQTRAACYAKHHMTRSLQLGVVIGSAGADKNQSTKQIVVTPFNANDHIGSTHHVAIQVRDGKLHDMFYDFTKVYTAGSSEQTIHALQSRSELVDICVGRPEGSASSRAEVWSSQQLAFRELSVFQGSIDTLQIHNYLKTSLEMKYGFTFVDASQGGAATEMYQNGRLFSLSESLAALTLLRPEAPSGPQLKLALLELVNDPMTGFSITWKGDTSSLDNFGGASRDLFLDASLVTKSDTAWSILMSYTDTTNTAEPARAYKFRRIDLTLQEDSTLNISVTKKALISSYAKQSYLWQMSDIASQPGVGTFEYDIPKITSDPQLVFAGNRAIVALTAYGTEKGTTAPGTNLPTLAYQAFMMESCAFDVPPCSLHVPQTIKHTPDRSMLQDHAQFDIRWFAPCSFDASTRLGFHVCTGRSLSAASSMDDCGGCFRRSSGMKHLMSTPLSNVHMSEIQISFTGSIDPFIIVCSYTAEGGLSQAAFTSIMDGSPHECTLGKPCQVSIHGAGERSAIKVVFRQFGEHPDPQHIVQPWLADLDADASWCKTQAALLFEPAGIGTFDAQSCYDDVQGASGCTFDLGIGVQSPGYYGICLNTVALATAVEEQTLTKVSNDGLSFFYDGVPVLLKRTAIANSALQQGSAWTLGGLLYMYGPDANVFAEYPREDGNWPPQRDTIAVRGQELSVGLAGLYGSSLPASRIMIMSSECPLPIGSQTNRAGTAASPVFGWPTELTGEMFQGLDAVYGVSLPSRPGSDPGPYVYTVKNTRVQPAGYSICWCNQGDNKQDSCIRPFDFHVRAGTLDFVGPYTPGTEHICWRGRACKITEYGVLFTAADTVHVCENRSFLSPYSWKEVAVVQTVATKKPGTDATSLMEVLIREPIAAGPLRYSLCWKSGRGVHLGVNVSIDGAPLALMRVVGPPIASLTDFTCKLGAICRIQLEVINPSSTLSYDLLAQAIRGELAPDSWRQGVLAANLRPSTIMLKGPIGASAYSFQTVCDRHQEASLALDGITRARVNSTEELPDGVNAVYRMPRRYHNVDPGDRYLICWCIGFPNACTQESDFRAFAGEFLLNGPWRDTRNLPFRCAMGSECQIELYGSGLSVQTDKLIVKNSQGACNGEGRAGFYNLDCKVGASSNACYKRDTGTDDIMDYEVCPERCETGLADFPAVSLDVSAYMETGLRFKWSGDDVMGGNGNYSVCWCGELNGCFSPEDFQFFVQPMLVDGDQVPKDHVCVTGPTHLCMIDVDGDFFDTEVTLKEGATCREGAPISTPGVPTGAFKGAYVPDRPGVTRFNLGAVTSYGWQGDVEFGMRGRLAICWCGNIGVGTCPDHRVFIGNLIIEGPVSSTENAFSCVLGQWCNIPALSNQKIFGATYTTKEYRRNVDMQFVGPDQGDYLAIAPSGYCGKNVSRQIFPFQPSSSKTVLGRSRGMTLPHSFSWILPGVEASGSFSMGVSPGEFHLCWCRGSCEHYEEYLGNPAGSILIAGPTPGQIQECVRGRDCGMSITGVSLYNGDVLETVSFLGTCGGEAPSGHSRGQVKNQALLSVFRLNERAANGDQWVNQFCHAPGIYKICWCQPIYIGMDYCNAVVEVGSVQVKGPFSSDIAIKMGEHYNISGVNGIGLTNTRDYVMLLRECGQPNNDTFPLVWIKIDNASSTYYLGELLRSRVAGITYQKCWCQEDAAVGSVCQDNAEHYNTPFGEVAIYCKEGEEDDPLDPGTCIECSRGRWLQNPAPGMTCQACPENSNTQQTGMLELADCMCDAGYYWDAGSSTCKTCSVMGASTGKQLYCPGHSFDIYGNWIRAEPQECPTNSAIANGQNTPTSIQSCLCIGGYAPDPEVSPNTTNFACNGCQVGQYKPERANVQCRSCADVQQGSTTDGIGSAAAASCVCPPSTYRISGRCVTCRVGFYCPGQLGKCAPACDGDKILCPSGSTTLQAGATNQSACLCDLGHFSQGEGSQMTCHECLAGTFKSNIGNVPNACPGACPTNSTSGAGAHTLSNCFCKPGHQDPNLNDEVLECQEPPPGQEGSTAGGLTQFNVPAVQSMLRLTGVTRPASETDTINLAKKIAQEAASTYGIHNFRIDDCTFVDLPNQPNVVRVECDDVDTDLDFEGQAAATSATSANATSAISATATTANMSADSTSTSSRRLSNAAAVVHLTVRRPTVAKAEEAAREFRAEELTTRLTALNEPMLSGLQNTSHVVAPVVTEVSTKCPDLKALPTGAAFVSVSKSCKCKAGYEPSAAAANTGACTPCSADTFKTLAGDHACTACPTLRKTIPELGANASSLCFCDAGYAATDGGACGKCGEGVYCPKDTKDSAASCPPGTKNASSQLVITSDASRPLKQALSDCACVQGLTDFRQTQNAPANDYPVSPCMCPNNHYLFKGACKPCGTGCDPNGGACVKVYLQCQYMTPAELWQMRFVIRSARDVNHTCGTDPSGWTAACAYSHGLSGLLLDYATHLLPATAAGYYATPVSGSGRRLKSAGTSGSTAQGSTDFLQTANQVDLNATYKWWPPGLEDLANIDDLSMDQVNRLKSIYDQYDIGQQILECADDKTCLGNNECAAGREGRACGRCMEGYSGGAKGECKKCDRNSVLTSLSSYCGFIIAIIAFFQMTFARHTDVGEAVSTGLIGAVRSCGQSVQLCVRYCQSLGVAVNFKFDMPTLNIEAWNMVNFVTLDLPTIMNTGCMMGNSFSLLMLGRLGLSLALAAALLSALVVNNLLAVLFKCLAKLCRSERQIIKWVSVTQVPIAYASLFFIFFLSMLMPITSFFTCINMPDGSFAVLDRRDVQCGFPFSIGVDTEWNGLAPLALVVLIMYVVCSYTFLVLFIYRGIKKGKDKVLENFRSQYITYRKGTYWWLIITISKEFLYALTGIIFPGDGYWQALWSMSILMTYMLAVYTWMPFTDNYLNYQEVFLQLFAAVQLMLAGLSGFGGQLTDEEREMKSRTLLVVQVAGMGVMCVCLAIDVLFLTTALWPRADSCHQWCKERWWRCKKRLWGELAPTDVETDLAIMADVWTAITCIGARKAKHNASFKDRLWASNQWLFEAMQMLDRHEQRQLMDGLILVFAVASIHTRKPDDKLTKNLGANGLRRYSTLNEEQAGHMKGSKTLDHFPEEGEDTELSYFATEFALWDDEEMFNTEETSWMRERQKEAAVKEDNLGHTSMGMPVGLSASGKPYLPWEDVEELVAVSVNPHLHDNYDQQLPGEVDDTMSSMPSVIDYPLQRSRTKDEPPHLFSSVVPGCSNDVPSTAASSTNRSNATSSTTFNKS